jgi:hypothetical protein
VQNKKDQGEGMMRKSRNCAPQAGAAVVDFVPQRPPVIVAPASFILNVISFFSLRQVVHQRKEQP